MDFVIGYPLLLAATFSVTIWAGLRMRRWMERDRQEALALGEKERREMEERWASHDPKTCWICNRKDGL